MVILDTNFICSLFNQFDTNHSQAIDIFFALPFEEQIRVPFIVAAELSVYPESSDYLNAAKEISGRFIMNNQADLEFVTLIKNSQTLKSNDCLILALCHRLKANLLTFDMVLKNAMNTDNLTSLPPPAQPAYLPK